MITFYPKIQNSITVSIRKEQTPQTLTFFLKQTHCMHCAHRLMRRTVARLYPVPETIQALLSQRSVRNSGARGKRTVKPAAEISSLILHTVGGTAVAVGGVFAT